MVLILGLAVFVNIMFTAITTSYENEKQRVEVQENKDKVMPPKDVTGSY